MTITDILSKYYNDLYDMLRDKETLVSETKTDEDHLQDICLTAIRKYKDHEIDEEEGKTYLIKSLLMMLKFKYKRKDKDTVYISSLPDFAEFPCPESEI